MWIQKMGADYTSFDALFEARGRWVVDPNALFEMAEVVEACVSQRKELATAFNVRVKTQSAVSSRLGMA